MVELKTAEHIAHFMMGNISLSRFDKKFVESLQVLKQVTTNQVELFYRIIYKYRRQLSKHELDADVLIHLPWTMKVVESATQYTDGHVSIENNQIIFKCPYNKSFIDAFRKEVDNTFVWDKERRQYSVDYSTHSLKILIKVATNFFKAVHYCDITSRLLAQVKEYESCKYWKPTLVRINGNLFIVASNEELDNALGDTVLDTSPPAITKLIYHGIHIDETVYDTTDERQKFIYNLFYQIEVQDALNIIPWLTEIGCDYVIFTGNRILPEVRKKLKEEMAKVNIHVDDAPVWSNQHKSNDNEYSLPVVIRFRTSRNNGTDEPLKVGKIVQLVNSQPIDIK